MHRLFTGHCVQAMSRHLTLPSAKQEQEVKEGDRKREQLQQGAPGLQRDLGNLPAVSRFSLEPPLALFVTGQAPC